MTLTVGSLFSGIGGIDLGLQRAGMTTSWFVEWDPFCRHILEARWPGTPVYGDIHDLDPAELPPVDVLAGGFPCQPVSTAGSKLAQSDPRWLWPEFARLVRGLRPRYVLVENVRNLLTVNGGSAFSEVLGDLAACGYDAEWDCLPAAAVGAPHLRDRLWLVAYPSGQPVGDADLPAPADPRGPGPLARPDPPGRGAGGGGRGRAPLLAHADGLGAQVPDRGHDPAEPVAGGDSGPRGSGGWGWWAAEPEVGRVADGVPRRLDRLHALGNGVVPQVAQVIGAAIVADASTTRRVRCADCGDWACALHGGHIGEACSCWPCDDCGDLSDDLTGDAGLCPDCAGTLQEAS